MRPVLVLAVFIAWCASADAATVRRSKPVRARAHPVQQVTSPKSYAVPGWSEEQTRRWLDDATGPRD
jgi:hypothetical protein